MIATQFAAATGLFQFTPLREGRRIKQAMQAMDEQISIHAPT